MPASNTDTGIPASNEHVVGAASNSGLPGDASLREGLIAVLGAKGLQVAELVILAREKNTYTSTFPSEIITCRVGSGRVMQLFLKYSADRENEAYGHRGGVGYEASVYGQLLEHLDISTARLHGIYRGPDRMNTWLVLDYLEAGERMTHTIDPDAMVKAARWTGRFHALCSTRVSDPALSFINRYDPDYYRGWVDRTQLMVRQAGVEPAWLRALCSRIDEVIGVLCDAPQTIIHGEFYPKNILLQDGLIYPVDWESAAIGSGMIDLAMLTEGWATDITRELVQAYQHSRWPEAPPTDIEKDLHAAWIYVQFRWLGDQSWLGNKRTRLSEWNGYLDALHEHAEEMRLI